MATAVRVPTVPTRIALRNILVATDFSPCSEVAIPYAMGLAKHYDATLINVHVLPHEPFVESPRPEPTTAWRSAQMRLAKLAQGELAEGIKHKEIVEQGETPQVLLDLVRKHGVDLMVLGTGGRKGLGKLLLGSVAELVFRNAECPVLTIGPHVVRGAIADGGLRHILYCTDFGPESIRALPFAVSLAEEHKARLTLLHVSPEPPPLLTEPEPGGLPVVPLKEVVAAAERHLRKLLPSDVALWHEPEFMVQFGPPAETVIRIAEQNVDMIVLGVKRPAALTKHMGAGFAYNVVCQAPCPVLSVSARYRA